MSIVNRLKSFWAGKVAATEASSRANKLQGFQEELERLKGRLAALPDETEAAHKEARRVFDLRETEIEYNSQRRKIDFGFQIQQVLVEIDRLS